MDKDVRANVALRGRFVRMFEEGPQVQKYTKVLQELKKLDEEVYGFLLHNVRSCDYETMMARLKTERPDLHRKALRVLAVSESKIVDRPLRVGKERGEAAVEPKPEETLREVYGELKKTYSCKEGFGEQGPQRRTVTIRMKGDRPIFGLPKGFIDLQKKMILDVGSRKKWTFSFDNRIATAELSDEQIEELKKNPLVESVVDEGIVRILTYPSNPPYDPNIENIDWGVARVHASIPWDKNIKGQGVKVCVIDSGVKTTHPDLQARYRGGWNFISGNNNPEDDQDHGCLAPDGLIYTSLGVQSIERFWERFVKAGEKEIDISRRNIRTIVLDAEVPRLSDARIKKIFKIAVNGDTITVKAKSGLHLTLTPWHPTFVFDGKEIIERRADALQVGDFLLRPAISSLMSKDLEKPNEPELDEDLAYALGLFLGDGFFRPRYRDSIGLSSTESSIGRKFLGICAPYVTSTAVELNKRTGATSYIAYGKPFYQMIRKLADIPEGVRKTYNIVMPSVITSSSPAVIGAFLAGYLDTDGHVSGRVNTVVWSTVSRAMADQLAFLLSLLGIKSQLVICPSRKPNEVDCYQVTVTGIGEIRKLSGHVGRHLTSKKRKERLARIVKKTVPWNVRNTGVPLTSEVIDDLRSEARTVGMKGRILKGAKDRRTATGPARYRLLEVLARMGKTRTSQYYGNLVESFHFDSIVSIKRTPYHGYFYDLNVEDHHNYLAGNFGATFIHNTWCAGILCGDENGMGYKGVAPKAELYACKMMNAKGTGNAEDLAAAVDWCVVNGMDIISMSVGGGASPTEEAAVNNAWVNGLLLVAAAGNSGPGMNTVECPGAYAACIAVAAIDYQENVPNWSSRGPQVEISAPGVNISGPWAGFTYGSGDHDYLVENSNDLYMVASGTSPACPHVAGTAALIKCWYPDATNTQIRQWLRDYVTDL